VTTDNGDLTVAVTLLVSATPVIITDPGALTLSYNPDTSFPGYQFLKVTSSSVAQQFNYTMTADQGWLKVYVNHLGSSTAGPPSSVQILPLSLGPGVNAGHITITADGAANSPVTIPVTVIAPAAEQTITASPATLSFWTAAGVNPAAKTVDVSTANPDTVTAVATSTGNWLSVAPSSSATPATLTVSVNTAGLSAGATYDGTVTLTAGSATKDVAVTLTINSVTPTATLEVDDVSPVFTWQQGADLPASQTLQVHSSGGQVTFTTGVATTDGAAWLSATPASGSTPATLTVSVDPTGLAPGDYAGTVTITSPAATNSPLTRSVTLTVTPAPKLAATPNALSFTYRVNGIQPVARTVAITSTGDQLPFNAASDSAWLTVVPGTGTTPANLTITADPTDLQTGAHTGKITVATTGIAVSSSVTITVTFTVNPPLPTITSISNVLSYTPGPIAPGELVALTGTFLAPDTKTTLVLDNTGKVSTTLAGVTVYFNGIPGPLYYVQANQCSAIVPYEIAGSAQVSVWLEYNGARSNAVTVDVAAAAPGLITADGSGQGPAIALNEDGNMNSADHPAARGTIVVLIATGEGQTVPAGVTGKVNSDFNNLPRPVLPVSVAVGGVPALNIPYAGAAPAFVSGVMQLNVQIPAAAPTGIVSIVLSVGTASSRSDVTIFVN
jgi:uncharacterized protein (TIGR03437 family)